MLTFIEYMLKISERLGGSNGNNPYQNNKLKTVYSEKSRQKQNKAYTLCQPGYNNNYAELTVAWKFYYCWNFLVIVIKTYF